MPAAWEHVGAYRYLVVRWESSDGDSDSRDITQVSIDDMQHEVANCERVVAAAVKQHIISEGIPNVLAGHLEWWSLKLEAYQAGLELKLNGEPK